MQQLDHTAHDYRSKYTLSIGWLQYEKSTEESSSQIKNGNIINDTLPTEDKNPEITGVVGQTYCYTDTNNTYTSNKNDTVTHGIPRKMAMQAFFCPTHH